MFRDIFKIFNQRRDVLGVTSPFWPDLIDVREHGIRRRLPGADTHPNDLVPAFASQAHRQIQSIC